jgi:hypothetical protein
MGGFRRRIFSALAAARAFCPGGFSQLKTDIVLLNQNFIKSKLPSVFRK